MKKIITLLFACLLMMKVFAGPSFTMSYSNISQGTNVPNLLPNNWMNVSANYGDSVSFVVSYSGCSGQYPSSQWFFNGDTIANANGVYSITVVIYQSGTYASFSSSCPFPPLNFYVTNITGISPVQNINYLNVFPTAVTSSITVQLNSIKTNDVEISFFDMNGRQLKNDFYKNVIGEFIKNENTEALAKGIYFLRIKTGEDVMEKKFVKM